MKVESRVKVYLQFEEQHWRTLGEAAVIRNLYMRKQKFSKEFEGDQGPAGHRRPFTTRVKRLLPSDYFPRYEFVLSVRISLLLDSVT